MDLSIALQSLFMVLLFSFLFRFYSKNQQKTKRPQIYGLKSYPIIGHLPYFIRNRNRFLEWVTEILLQSPTRTMGFCSVGSTCGIITADPANLEHVFKLKSSNYPKGERIISMMEDFLGHGIANADGEDWKWQRKIASFEFNKNSLRSFLVETVHFEISNRLLPILNQAAREGVMVELQDALERFAFDNICRVVFGEDPACLTKEDGLGETSSSKEFRAALSDAQELSTSRYLEPFEVIWKIKRFLNIGKEKRLKKAISIVQEYLTSIIRSRISMGMGLEDREDMLSRFTSNKNHNEIAIRDAIINFIIAGTQTTPTSLTWFFWLVSTRPEVESKIIHEIKYVRTSNRVTTETFSFDDLRNMNYLHAAITESMRLYPTVPLDTVSCKEDDVMPDGTFVGKGWYVSYNAYAMGRSEDIWGKDCMDFKPERWLDESGVFKAESPFRYPIFHAGPRMCLGKEMAYIQMKSIVACVLERFSMKSLRPEGIPEHTVSFTLKDEGWFTSAIQQARRSMNIV